MVNNAKCRWCREQAGCHVVSARIKEPNGPEHGVGFIICEACQRDFRRYVGQIRKSLPTINDDDPREWLLIESANDRCETDRRVYVDEVADGRAVGPVDDARFGMGRDWCSQILFTKRIGVGDAPWEIVVMRNNGGQLECLNYENESGTELPAMDGTGLSVFEVLDLSV